MPTVPKRKRQTTRANTRQHKSEWSDLAPFEQRTDRKGNAYLVKRSVPLMMKNSRYMPH